jgi:predicted NACHT family NTPase
MSTELNPNAIAAAVIQSLITNSAKSIARGVRDSVSKILDGMNKDITKYVEATATKCSFIRTPIINRDHSTPLADIYVSTKLRIRKKVLLDDDFISNLNGADSIVITGNAGSGKSVFMKYLFLALCNAKRNKVPLLFELRDLNGSTKKNLEEFLYYNLIGPGAVITQEQFSSSLRAGIFTLILDGFDEVNFDDRKEIEQQIRQLRNRYADLQIIISSRPDPERRFETWTAFDVVQVEPMDEAQALKLVKNLDYDRKVKALFSKSIREGLFKSHGSFLSNPLLCIMMLVTFDQSGHIPNKRHVFYEKAFDALTFLHDSAKEGVYKRKTYTNLPSDEFANCLSAFGVVTYLKQKLTFSKRELRDSLAEAFQIEGKTIDLDEMMSDMIESICLIQAEGTDFTFTHRSFQEYFTAVFISRGPAGISAILDRVAQRLNDDVLAMSFAINHSLIEREWITPKIEALLKTCEIVEMHEDPIKLSIALFGGAFVAVKDGKATGIHRAIYPHGAQVLGIGACIQKF